MKAMVLAVALLTGTAALAQDYGTDPSATPDTMAPDSTMPDTMPDAPTSQVPPVDATVTSTADTSTTYSTAVTPAPAPAGGQIVAASNANPEHDARGIAVISDPAVVPAGFNNQPSGAMGGPLVDPATGESVSATADAEYPACSATVTDNCLQTYERGRAPQ